MVTEMLFIYLLTGTFFALAVLFWAFKSRQFEEQDRARFLPLRDLTEEELSHPPRRKFTPSVLLFFVVLALGLGVLGRMLFLVLTSRPPGT